MGSNEPGARRNLSVESLRGLAVILMVAGHVIGSSAARGMQVADDSGWRLFYLALEDLRMPLFTALSGFVYAYRPLRSPGAWPTMVKGKARRLLIPMATVGTAYFLLQLMTPGTNTKPEPGNYWRIYVFGYEHLWFLQSIFLIFLLIGVLSFTGVLKTFRGWLSSTAVSMAVFVLVSVPGDVDVFSVGGALRLLPFFLLGYGLHTFGSRFRSSWLRAALLSLVALTLTARVVTVIGLWHLTDQQNRLLSVLVGASGIILLLVVRDSIKVRWLAWLGPYSFGVYLLHVFGTAGARLLLERLGVDLQPVVFLIALTVGVVAPVVFALLFGHVSLISWAVLGQKPTARPQLRARPRPRRRSGSGPVPDVATPVPDVATPTVREGGVAP